MNLRDTIVAISTPPGRGGLGVVRLSGARSREIAERILSLKNKHAWHSWHSELSDLTDSDGAMIDQAVVSFFERPRSYTGEDVVEITSHGSPVVLRTCVERAVAQGARVAEPGEFTLRAYLSGRIDLPQAEAVRELIEATTLYQARVAAQQLHGSVSNRIRPVKEQLVELISLLEAGIDFAEDDVSVASPDEIFRRLAPIARELDRLIASYAAGKLVFDGFTLAIAGRPNVGKSSLFNRLLEQDRAIVTEIPGTTRDMISESMSLNGIPVRLVDTAGIRASDDLVEGLGIQKSYQAVADADLTILVLDGSRAETGEDRALREKLDSGNPLVVANKSDLPTQIAEPVSAVHVSALTGAGIPELKNAILRRLAPAGLAQRRWQYHEPSSPELTS